MRNKEIHEPKESKKVPLWKWLVIIFLVLAMPLFFAFVRSIQLQQAINDTSQPLNATSTTTNATQP